MRFLLIIVFLAGPRFAAFGQEPRLRKGIQHQIGAEFNVPIDELVKTHGTGVAMVYSISSRLEVPTYGRFRNIGGLFTSSIQYFPGKKENGAGYSFRHDNYYRFNLAGGITGRPFSIFSYSLLTGVTFGSTSGQIRLGYNVQIQTLFLLSEKFSAGPGIFGCDMQYTRPMTNLSFRAMYTF